MRPEGPADPLSAEKLLHWIQRKYAGILIRSSEEPYINHLLAVAAMVKDIFPLAYEIGLCHDLLEDTPTTANQLWEALLSFNYTKPQAGFIVQLVAELTDVYTASAYPDLKKAVRKKKEAHRLSGLGAGAQTVKYADLIYNINWTVTYDKANAGRYLKRKMKLLDALNAGDEALREQAQELIRVGQAAVRSGS